MEYLDTIAFLDSLPDTPLIDVRSPREYAKGHIPGALNIPIFSDEERAVVGTLYKQKGRVAAIQKGLEFVGPKMKQMSEAAMALAGNDRLRVYCWRGGMRSEKMSWLFELVGINCYVLKGGFKAFRRQLLVDLANLPGLVVLQGPTGTGKTDVLSRLAGKGEQVIDLEALAHHRGSAFGHIGMEEQPSSQQFQNDLYLQFRSLDPHKRIWIESESMSIGKVYLPETLWESINRAPVVELSIPRKERIKRLVEEYGQYDRELLITSTRKISGKFGSKNVDEVLDYLKEGDLDHAAALLLDYYDRSYRFSQGKYKERKPAVVESNSGDPEKNAEKVLNIVEEINLRYDDTVD